MEGSRRVWIFVNVFKADDPRNLLVDGDDRLRRALRALELSEVFDHAIGLVAASDLNNKTSPP